jgi:hypothetical protein
MKRAAILLACLAPLTAHAKPMKGQSNDPHSYTQQTAVQRSDRVRHQRSGLGRREVADRHSRAHARIRTVHSLRDGHATSIIGGRPAGCPPRYCGCGTSIKVFGRNRPELHLAANWLLKFPRTSAAPNMVAARSGHVMLLLEHAGADKWKVWDANSGKGLTRIHVRSIRGFAVVNPHANRTAGL